MSRVQERDVCFPVHIHRVRNLNLAESAKVLVEFYQTPV